MFKNAVFSLVGFIFVMFNANGRADASARPCSSLDNGSCWATTNYGRQPVDLLCTTASWTLVSLTALPPGARDTVQFDSGYGDGLGFPEPDVSITCSARLSNGQRAEVAFSSHGWGDRVEIIVDRDQLRVTSTEYWRRVPPYVVTARFSAQ